MSDIDAVLRACGFAPSYDDPMIWQPSDAEARRIYEAKLRSVRLHLLGEPMVQILPDGTLTELRFITTKDVPLRDPWDHWRDGSAAADE